MPHRQEAIDPNRGPVTEIIVSVDSVQAQVLRSSGQAVPTVSLRALIDTGADCTFVDARHLPFLVQPLPVFQIVARPTEGVIFLPQYEVSLTILHPSGDRRRNLLRRVHCVVDIELPPHLGYEAIIGRDLLDDCLFWYDGPNRNCVLGW